MPTISIDPVDYQELLGEPTTAEQFEKYLDLVKGEFKGVDEQGLWRVELNDTNRPDLWSAEGIARQIRSAMGSRRDYSFFSGEPIGEIHVKDQDLMDIRPYVAAFVVRGVRVTDRCLKQIIQTQEKLAENYGRKRKDVAIGVYRAEKIKFPVTYSAVDPKQYSYVPLGFDEPMSLAEILEKHPKGIEYRDALAGHDKVPYLRDAQDLVLSMPPIINSKELGEVVAGDTDLFVEATGTDLMHVILALNIMACDLADRTGRIERIRTLYPFDTPLGRRVDVPYHMDLSLTVPLAEFSKMLGVNVRAVELDNVLERYGCDVSIADGKVTVSPPPTRADYLHQVDVVEDFAVARGYETFEPRMPGEFTPGRPSDISVLEDKARDLMIGMGYEEIISNILFSRDALIHRMNRPDDSPLVEVANVMNENFSALRDGILPCLLNTESRSAAAAYPHRLFEAGDVAVFEKDSPVGSVTLVKLGGLIAHREANLSQAHADLDFLLQMLEVPWELDNGDHPSFLPGRCARILIQGEHVGWLGEIHPEVLQRWEIGVPCAGFELSLDSWV